MTVEIATWALVILAALTLASSGAYWLIYGTLAVGKIIEQLQQIKTLLSSIMQSHERHEERLDGHERCLEQHDKRLNHVEAVCAQPRQP